MTSVASLALCRMLRSSPATIFFALFLAAAFQPDVSLAHWVELDHCAQPGDNAAGEADFTPTDGHAWVAGSPVVDSHARGPHLQLPSLRLEPTFGDTTWSNIAADEGHAAATAAQRRACAAVTHRTAPLGVSLQARDVRLQI